MTIQVQHVNQQLEESERVLQERIFKLEGQRIQLEEVRALSIHVSNRQLERKKCEPLAPRFIIHYTEMLMYLLYLEFDVKITWCGWGQGVNDFL